MRRQVLGVLVATSALAGASLVVLTAGPAAAVTVNDDASLRAAYGNAAETSIELANDIDLTNCGSGDLDRNSATDLTITGNGHTIRQTCAGERVMNQAGTGAITLDGVTVTGGTPAAPGGGISMTASGAALTLNNSTVSGNTVSTGGNGGGIVTQGPVTLTDSTVSANSTGGPGGGISANGTVSLTNSTVRGNTAGTPGGGILATGVNLTSSTVSGNTAGTAGAFGGGGISSSGPVTATRSTLSGNTAGGDGGGIFTVAKATLTNSTVTGNTAGEHGGGVAAGDVVLVYATVVANTAPTGANIEILSFDSLTSFGSVVALPTGGGENCNFQPVPVTVSNGYNFSDDTSCGLTGTGDTQNGGDPGLGALADNGGATQTRLPQGGSPLIDAIPTASCQADGASGITTDQRGVTRPQGAGCDIGAVEVTVTATTPAATPVPAVVRFTG